MIVRDEARHLPACLQSIRDVVDEIVIVDTGSSDDSIGIARSFGARVLTHAWNGDFSAARNVGLDAARGQWILYIDADERLRPIAREQVRRTLQDASGHISLRLRLFPSVGSTPYWEFRLWRSDPRIRFVGAMHEKVTPAIAAIAASDGLAISESELCLDHVGYEGDQTHKHLRNLPLLQAQNAAEPSNSHNWAHLARVLHGLGRDAEALEASDRALATAREQGLSVDVLAFSQHIEREREAGRDVTALIDEALTVFPESYGLAWEKAQAEIALGRHESALDWLEPFDIDPTMPVEDTVAYRAELFGARTAEMRGLCLFRLGRYGAAAQAYREVEKLEPDVPSHRVRRVLAEHRAARNDSEPGDDEPPVAATRTDVRWRAAAALTGVTLDIGGVGVRLRATDAVRATAMQNLLGYVTTTERAADVGLSFGAHLPPVPSREPDERTEVLCLWRDDEALTVTDGIGIAGRVSGAHGVIGGYSRQLRSIFRYFAPLMLASLLPQRGSFLLHCGTVQRDGEAMLIIGNSGSGKSTLTFGASRCGWSVLSDDLSVVRMQANTPMVCGIPKPLVVPGDVLGKTRARPLPKDPRGRRQLDAVTWDRDWHPITGIVVVGHGTSETAQLQTIGSTELMSMVLGAMLCDQTRVRRDYMKLAMALCALPARRILHPLTARTRAGLSAEALTSFAASLRVV